MGVEPQVGPSTEGWVLIDIPIMTECIRRLFEYIVDSSSSGERSDENAAQLNKFLLKWVATAYTVGADMPRRKINRPENLLLTIIPDIIDAGQVLRHKLTNLLKGLYP